MATNVVCSNCQLIVFDLTVWQKNGYLPESRTSTIARLLGSPVESSVARTSRPMRGRVAIEMDDIFFVELCELYI